MTLISLLFKIAAYVSSASLLIMNGKELFENTAAGTVFRPLHSSESFPHPLRKRVRSVDTTYSSTAAAATSSPLVSVCHKWCYISLVFIFVGKCLESQWSEDICNAYTNLQALCQDTSAITKLSSDYSLKRIKKSLVIGICNERDWKVC